MVWGCVAAISKGKVAQVEERLDSITYQQMLEANITCVKKNISSKEDELTNRDII